MRAGLLALQLYFLFQIAVRIIPVGGGAGQKCQKLVKDRATQGGSRYLEVMWPSAK